MLLGERISMRRIERGDLWKLWDWHELEELYIFTRYKQSISYQEISEIFNDYFHKTMDFIIECKNKPIGICSSQHFIWKNRSCEFSCKFYEGNPDKLLSIDAVFTFVRFLFQEMNLFRIDSLIPEDDFSSIDILKKTGFESEGRLREHIYRDGSYKDVLIFTLFKKNML